MSERGEWGSSKGKQLIGQAEAMAIWFYLAFSRIATRVSLSAETTVLHFVSFGSFER